MAKKIIEKVGRVVKKEAESACWKEKRGDLFGGAKENVLLCCETRTNCHL
jgi:hypothetical protein